MKNEILEKPFEICENHINRTFIGEENETKIHKVKRFLVDKQIVISISNNGVYTVHDTTGHSLKYESKWDYLTGGDFAKEEFDKIETLTDVLNVIFPIIAYHLFYKDIEYNSVLRELEKLKKDEIKDNDNNDLPF